MQHFINSQDKFIKLVFVEAEDKASFIISWTKEIAEKQVSLSQSQGHQWENIVKYNAD